MRVLLYQTGFILFVPVSRAVIFRREIPRTCVFKTLPPQHSEIFRSLCDCALNLADSLRPIPPVLGPSVRRFIGRPLAGRLPARNNSPWIFSYFLPPCHVRQMNFTVCLKTLNCIDPTEPHSRIINLNSEPFR